MKRNVWIALAAAVVLTLICGAAAAINYGENYYTWTDRAVFAFHEKYSGADQKVLCLCASRTGNWEDPYQTVYSDYVASRGEGGVYYLSGRIANFCRENGQDWYFGCKVIFYPFGNHDIPRTEYGNFKQFKVLWLKNAERSTSCTVHDPLEDDIVTDIYDRCFLFDKDEEVSVTCSVQDGYRFTGWLDHGEYCSPDFTLPILFTAQTPDLEPRTEPAERIDTVRLEMTMPADGAIAQSVINTLHISPEEEQPGYRINLPGTYWTEDFLNGTTRYDGVLEGGYDYYLHVPLYANGGYAFRYTEDETVFKNMTDVDCFMNGQEAINVRHVVDRVNQDLWMEMIVPVHVPNVYTVSFDVNGHGIAPKDQKVTEGEQAKYVSVSASGYRFKGWYLDPGCTQRFSFAAPVEEDLMLFAKWDTLVDSVDIRTGGPAAGLFPGDVDFRIEGDAEGLRLQVVGWEKKNDLKQWDTVNGNVQFTARQTYRVGLRVGVRNGFSLKTGTVPTVNGEPAEILQQSSDEIVFSATFVCGAQVKLSFDMNGYGDPIPDQDLCAGNKPMEPETPTSPDAVFLGYVKVVRINDKLEQTRDFSFDDPITENTEVRVLWKPIVSEIALWMSPPRPGNSTGDGSCYVTAKAGAEGYVPWTCVWYEVDYSSGPFTGNFLLGRTYCFRILVKSTEGREFKNSGLTASVENANVSGLTVTWVSDTDAVVEGSLVCTAAGYRQLTFDANGHGEDPAPIWIQDGTPFGRIFDGVSRDAYYPEDSGFFLADWMVLGSQPLSEISDTPVDADANLVAYWMEEIPLIRVYVPQPREGDTAGEIVPAIVNEVPEECGIASWYWTGSDGIRMEEAEAFAAGETYRLNLSFAVDEASEPGFHHSTVFINSSRAACTVADCRNLTAVGSFTVGGAWTVSFDCGENGDPLPSVIVADGAKLMKAIRNRFGGIPTLPDEPNRIFAGWENPELFPDGLNELLTIQTDVVLTPVYRPRYECKIHFEDVNDWDETDLDLVLNPDTGKYEFSAELSPQSSWSGSVEFWLEVDDNSYTADSPVYDRVTAAPLIYMEGSETDYSNIHLGVSGEGTYTFAVDPSELTLTITHDLETPGAFLTGFMGEYPQRMEDPRAGGNGGGEGDEEPPAEPYIFQEGSTLWACAYVSGGAWLEENPVFFIGTDGKTYGCTPVQTDTLLTLNENGRCPVWVDPNDDGCLYDFYFCPETHQMVIQKRRFSRELSLYPCCWSTETGIRLLSDIWCSSDENRNEMEYPFAVSPDQSAYLDGTEVTVTAPQIPGYTFAAWYYGWVDDYGYSVDEEKPLSDSGSYSFIIDGDHDSLIAIYNEADTSVHTVTFNTLGGSDIESQTVYHGEKAGEPAEPTKIGAVFSGWFTDEACGETNRFVFTTPVTEDLILFAKWTVPEPAGILKLPASLITIEAEAFNGIDAEAVIIPAAVSQIEGNPFAGSAVQYIFGYPGDAENPGVAKIFTDNFEQYIFIPVDDAWMAAH